MSHNAISIAESVAETILPPSKYAPRPDYQPPEPTWKGFDDFKDYIHPRQPTPNGQ